MAYTKTTWNTGDVITAEKLNHMEDGIVSNSGSLLVTFTPTSETTGTVDKTYSEIMGALGNGQIPFLVIRQGENLLMTMNFNGILLGSLVFASVVYGSVDESVDISATLLYISSENEITIELV